MDMEDKLAMEVSSRLEVQEALRVGTEIISLASVSRTSVSHIFEAVRKAALAVVASADCAIICPGLGDMFDEFIVEDTENGCGGVGGGEYFLVSSERQTLSKVALESSDMETAVLLTGRVIRAPGEGAFIYYILHSFLHYYVLLPRAKHVLSSA